MSLGWFCVVAWSVVCVVLAVAIMVLTILG